MKTFTDDAGASWIAAVREEETPRHHTRWFLVIESADGTELAIPEVRWQTRETGERTLRTMSDFELRRRVRLARERAGLEPGASPARGAPAD